MHTLIRISFCRLTQPDEKGNMDVNTTDPYEQKLYNMFKSFDVHSMDSLDKTALMELCTTLELKDRSAKLVANLIDPKRNNRVSFNEFKEGLLNLLGTDTEDNDNDGNPSQGERWLCPQKTHHFETHLRWKCWRSLSRLSRQRVIREDFITFAKQWGCGHYVQWSEITRGVP